MLANKYNHLLSVTKSSLDPTQMNTSSYNEDEIATVIASNCTAKKPRPKLINALTIAKHQAIADTEATSIFIMEGAAVDNKRSVVSPLINKLPDGKRI
jgi:hypothetical protein